MMRAGLRFSRNSRMHEWANSRSKVSRNFFNVTLTQALNSSYITFLPRKRLRNEEIGLFIILLKGQFGFIFRLQLWEWTCFLQIEALRKESCRNESVHLSSPSPSRFESPGTSQMNVNSVRTGREARAAGREILELPDQKPHPERDQRHLLRTTCARSF